MKVEWRRLPTGLMGEIYSDDGVPLPRPGARPDEPQTYLVHNRNEREAHADMCRLVIAAQRDGHE